MGLTTGLSVLLLACSALCGVHCFANWRRYAFAGFCCLGRDSDFCVLTYPDVFLFLLARWKECGSGGNGIEGRC